MKAHVAVYGDTFATRHDDKKQGVTVIVMQRVNDIDLSAHVLETLEEEYVLLEIEEEVDPAPEVQIPTIRIASLSRNPRNLWRWFDVSMRRSIGRILTKRVAEPRTGKAQ